MQQYLSDTNIITFLLLLIRLFSVIFFVPFFDNNLFPIKLKSALALFLTFLFFPLATSTAVGITSLVAFMMAAFLEVMMGFLVGCVLKIVFAALDFAGENISFVMGLSIASAFDPATGSAKPIVGNVLAMLAMVIALMLDFHHIIFMMIAKSLTTTPLGGFLASQSLLKYIASDFSNIFLIGFTMAFPIICIILMSDIVFGMIMKTHPQFNLLVIGFPVKIALAFFVIILIIPAIMHHFSIDLGQALEALYRFF